MASLTKSLEYTDRLGVYKRLEDVPPQYHLQKFTDSYVGMGADGDEDVWREFCEAYEYAQGSHEGYEKEVDRVGVHWQAFMESRGRHHALATPGDVEAWCTALVEEFSLRRALDYWLRVNRFYDWLQWHAEYPHRYNPALMAVGEDGAARMIWALNARRVWERRERYRRMTNE